MKDKKVFYEKEGKRTRLKAGGTAAALVAATAVFVILIQMEKSVLTQYEKGIVYTAVAEIPRGQVITQENCNKYFEVKELDKNCIPETALTSAEEIKGLYAAYDIDCGTFLTKGMFEALEEVVCGMSQPVIAGFRADDIYQVVGGVLRAGDRIHIYVVSENGGTTLFWDNVFIEKVFDQTGAVIANDDKTTSAQRINVYLDKADIEAFYDSLTSGSLRVVKVF